MKNIFMKQAYELALKGKGYTKTNPLVGAVIVKDGNIIGKGWHKKYGGPHAEIEALRQAGACSLGADIYVTLEPCNTYGKTPPCTQALIEAGVRRVFVGVLDPNPKHAGIAVSKLRDAGIYVEYGIQTELCASLIEGFTKFMLSAVPYVTMKVGQSLDGKIATRTGQSKWITSEESLINVHKLRKDSDAVLVGVGTVLADDPELTVRHVHTERQPARIVLDTSLRTPVGAKLVKSANEVDTIIITTETADINKVNLLKNSGVKVLFADRTPDGKIDLKHALSVIGEQKILQLFVEGGAEIFGAFMDEKLVDYINVFIAPLIIGGVQAKDSVGGEGSALLSDAPRIACYDVRRSGADIWVSGKLKDYSETVLELTAQKF